MTPPISVRLMHFSDVHFGVENYGKFDPTTGLNSRLLDFRRSLTHAIETAISADVEIAVFTGDAYKTRDPTQTHQREFANCLRLLTNAGIPVILLTGNHDISNARGRANAIEIFGALSSDLLTVIDRPTLTTVATSKGNVVQIAAIPYLTKSNILSNDLLGGLSVKSTIDATVDRYTQTIDWLATEAAKSPLLPTVFMGHFSVTTARIGTLQRSYLLNEAEVPKGDLTRTEFDYVALGHIHKFQDLNSGHVPPVVYSGSIDRIDFGERNEAKGFVIVDLRRGQTQYKFVEIPTRPFIEFDIDASRTEDPMEKIIGELRSVDLENAVVKLTYRIKSEDESKIDDRLIHETLSAAFIRIAIRKEIVDESRKAKGVETGEASDPINILRQYLNLRQVQPQHQEQLIQHAEALVTELRSHGKL